MNALPICKRSAIGRSFCLGFTLTELMVTLTVTVILVAIAVPSFNRLIISNKLTTVANDVTVALNAARIEAVKRNAPTQFCGSTASTTDPLNIACSTQTGAVYLYVSSANPTITQVLAPLIGLTSPVQLNGPATGLRFSGQGLAQQVGMSTLYNGTVADICSTSLTTNNHIIIKLVGGSTIQTSQSTSTTCTP